MKWIKKKKILPEYRLVSSPGWLQVGKGCAFAFLGLPCGWRLGLGQGETPCGQKFPSLDQMVRIKLIVYGMWDTICTLILDPQDDGATVHGFPGVGDGNLLTESSDGRSTRSSGQGGGSSLA